MASNESRLKAVMANILSTDASAIDARSSVDTIPTWDSLSHMKLVLALEEEFGISLTGEESVEILSYELIKAVLTEHGVGFDGASAS